MDFDAFLKKFDDLTDDQVDDLVIEIGKRKTKKKAKPAPAKDADDKKGMPDKEPDADDMKKDTVQNGKDLYAGSANDNLQPHMYPDSQYTPTHDDHVAMDKARASGKVNANGTFKDGFDGCTAHMKNEGKSAESAQALCAYIGRRAGKIGKTDETAKTEPAPVTKAEEKPVVKDEAMPVGKLVTVTKTEKGADFELEIPIFKLNDEDHEVAGVVYEPDVIDAQGDSASSDEIRKAAHKFLEDSRTIGLMHKENAGPRAKLVESYIVPDNMRYGNQIVKKGAWVIVVKITDPELWNSVKSGAITGFSMGGTARDGGPAKQ